MMALLGNRYVIMFLCAVGVVMGIYWTGHEAGAKSVQVKWDAERLKQQDAARKETGRTASVATQVEVKYVDRIRTVVKQGQGVVREVPVYVSPSANAHCTVPVGFVLLHDAAASGAPAGTAGNLDAPAPGVALTDVANAVTENYGSCQILAEQVKGWQEFYTQLRAR
jgi:hypothetical protein